MLAINDQAAGPN